MKEQTIISIACGEYSAKINLTRGANCISLRNEKYKARVLREPDYSKELDNPYLYGMPILFPVNRISGGRFDFEGREYIFPINEPKTGCHLHGELHQMEFELLETYENKVVCSYKATKERPYLGFPHEFEIRLTYELKEDGFYQTTEVMNLSDTNMPVFLGFHTTFNSLFTADSKPQDIRVLAEVQEEYERNMINYLPTGKKPKFDELSRQLAVGELSPFDRPISRHYRALESGKMLISDAGQKLCLVYENDEKYRFRLVYNGNADEYICLEPNTSLANCPNSPFDREEAGFDSIKPGEEKCYHSKIYVIEADGV